MTIDKGAKDAWQKLYLIRQVAQDGSVSIEMGNSSQHPVWFDQMKMSRRSVVVQHNKAAVPRQPAGKPIAPDTTKRGEVGTNGYYLCDYTCVTTPYGTTCSQHNCRYIDTSNPNNPPPIGTADPYQNCMQQTGGNSAYCYCILYSGINCNGNTGPGGTNPQQNAPVRTSPEKVQDPCKAINNLWSSSFYNGKVYKENSAWITEIGTILLPNSNNSSTYSDNDHLKIRKSSVGYQLEYPEGSNKWVKIYAHVHTHPNSHYGDYRDARPGEQIILHKLQIGILLNVILD